MALRGLHRRSMSSNSSSRKKAFVIGLLLLISIQSAYIFWTSSHLSRNDDYVKRGLLSSLGPPISSQREEALPASLLRKNQNDKLSPPPLEPNQELKLDDTSGWDPSKSVVMGMASGYGLNVYQQFVGSLRATGYSGHIILGVSTNIINENNNDVSRYLKSQNVTMKGIEMEGSVCTYNGTIDKDGKVIDMQKSGSWKCPKAYPDYKITWARFLFYRDWLKECNSCTDGVVLTDVRDAYFQRDPFVTAVQSKQNHPLVLFQEHPTMINTHWLTDIPVSSCREHKVGKTPVLCSGSVMGSREGILDYIDVMVDEFDYWKTREKCRIDMPGDDQSIHNYLYYTHRFKNVITVPHRRGSIHVVGYHAARIHKNATKEAEEKGIHDVGSLVKGSGGRWQEWLDTKRYDLLDPHTGLIVNLDGSPSAQVHQVDRFGQLNHQWMNKMIEYNWPYNRSPERGVALFESEAPTLQMGR